jgi:hypothetical protein
MDGSTGRNTAILSQASQITDRHEFYRGAFMGGKTAIGMSISIVALLTFRPDLGPTPICDVDGPVMRVDTLVFVWAHHCTSVSCQLPNN